MAFLPPWGTTVGVPPTVGSPARWGQTPTAVGHDGRILPLWGTIAASPLCKGATAAATAPPSLALSSESSAFNPSDRFLTKVCF
jgi:hypothetical protein